MIWLFVLLLCSCAPRVVAVVEVEVQQEFNVCVPLRGEDQADLLIIKGHAFNSTEYGCI